MSNCSKGLSRKALRWVLKIILIGIPNYAGMQTVSRADVGMETCFHASIGPNANSNNLLKPNTGVYSVKWAVILLS